MRDEDNFAQFFSLFLLVHYPHTIVLKLLELIITVFKISVIALLTSRFYCARWGQFSPIFFTVFTSSLSRTIVLKLLELTVTVFEISVITWLPFRFYCTRRGQFIPIFLSLFLVTNYLHTIVPKLFGGGILNKSLEFIDNSFINCLKRSLVPLIV